MTKHPGLGAAAQARYYEAVHQELAPLARQLERDLSSTSKSAEELSSLVRRLAYALRKASPGNPLHQQAMDYLNQAGIPTVVLREIVSGGE